MKQSTDLINKHGRRVSVQNARVEGLLKQGFTLAPDDTKLPAPAPEVPAEEAIDLDALRAELDAMTKADVVLYALEFFELELDEAAKKTDLVEAVLAKAAE